MKIVINRCFGGFGVSPEALRLVMKKGCKHFSITPTNGERDKWLQPLIIGKKTYWDEHSYDGRNCPFLVKVIEELGSEKASKKLASLEIVEIPDDVDWEISDYDGQESVHEKHRSW